MRVVYFLCAVVLLWGCYSEKRAKRDFIRSLAYPKIATDYCESRYPCVDSIIKGDSVVRFDTLYIPSGDTLYLDGVVTDTINVVKYKICPPTKVITKVITVTDTIKQTDKAALKSCQLDNSGLISQLNKRTSEYDQAKHSRNIWRLIALISISIIGLGTYAKIRGLV